MSVKNNPNSKTIPTLEVYDNELHNLDHLHVKLFKQLNKNTEQIEQLQQFQKKITQSKEWLVNNNSKGASTLGLGRYKCPKRKKIDEKIEKCLTWLLLKYNKMFRCFLSKAEKALVNQEIEEYKLVKNEIIKNKREIPIKNEDGSIKKGEKIKIKVLKTPDDLRREIKMNGGITVSQEVVDLIVKKNSCCKSKCLKNCIKDKKNYVSQIKKKMELTNTQKVILKTVEEKLHILPLV